MTKFTVKTNRDPCVVRYCQMLVRDKEKNRNMVFVSEGQFRTNSKGYGRGGVEVLTCGVHEHWTIVPVQNYRISLRGSFAFFGGGQDYLR